jgi:hypothetical protein
MPEHRGGAVAAGRPVYSSLGHAAALLQTRTLRLLLEGVEPGVSRALGLALPASLPDLSPASLPELSPASLPELSPASLPELSPASLPELSRRRVGHGH